MSRGAEHEGIPLRQSRSITKTISTDNARSCCCCCCCCCTTNSVSVSAKLSGVLYFFGGFSIIIASLQMFSYVLYLRYSTVDGDFLYITLFTSLGGLNCIFVWHVCRLLYMLHLGCYSRCNAASSRVWFYTSLFYLLANVLQTGWFFCLQDWIPLGLSVIAMVFCFVLFVFGSRKLHKLRGNPDEGAGYQRRPADGD